MPKIDDDKPATEQNDRATTSQNEKAVPTSHLIGIGAAIGLFYAGSKLFCPNPAVVADDDPIINAIMGPH